MVYRDKRFKNSTAIGLIAGMAINHISPILELVESILFLTRKIPFYWHL